MSANNSRTRSAARTRPCARPEFALAHSNRGNALHALRRHREAEAAYRRALRWAPDLAQAWNNLGTTLRDLEQPREAVEAYQQALVQMPDNPHCSTIWRWRSGSGAPAEAAALLRRALTIADRDPKLHLHLGAVLIDIGERETAAAASERALASIRQAARRAISWPGLRSSAANSGGRWPLRSRARATRLARRPRQPWQRSRQLAFAEAIGSFDEALRISRITRAHWGSGDCACEPGLVAHRRDRRPARHPRHGARIPYRAVHAARLFG